MNDAPPPFIAGPPILHPGRFFGRQREVRRIFSLLRHAPLQNAAIIGPRRSGKTSLLHTLRRLPTAAADELRPEQRQEWLPQAERYHWIFVDFQDARLGRPETLLRHLLDGLGLPAPEPCDLDHFLNAASGRVKAPTVVLLDEIGVALARYPALDDAFWESLRSLATNQAGGRLAFILATHEPPHELARRGGLGSPFFNIFGYTTTLGPLAEEDARHLLASSPIPFAPADVAWMLEQSGRWPYPLQILARERLFALEEGESGDGWRPAALRQLAAIAVEEPAGRPVALPEPLSERELEVLGLIAAGLSNQEIAGRLVVAVSTIKTHVNNIYGKLNVRNRTEAVARARELKLL